MAQSAAADCRILVISPSAEQARQFVERVQGLSGSSTPTASFPAESPSNVFPWTIVNKYYTADVHFQTKSYSEFRIPHADGVPAVVYVWEHGQSYRDHIEDIASRLRDHDPEVSLAVRFSDSTPTTLSEEDGLDEFLSSHGFEYVEGDREPRPPTQDEGRHTDDADAGFPGLSRVLDALSTIMWPSLVQSESTRTRKSRARELLDWARDEEGDDGLRALISGSGSAGDVSFSDSQVAGSEPRKSRMQREMEELEQWLADEDRARQAVDAQAWMTVERDVPLPSSAWQDMPTPSIRTPTAETPTFGFDDDFTHFVSAPSPVVSTRSHNSGLDVDHLLPQHSGASYHSLASVSDFGGEGEHTFVSHTDDSALPSGYEDDPHLPSRAEVMATSRRIFGSVGPAQSPPSTFAAQASPHEPGESHPFDHDDDDDFEMSAFDLSRVLSALQGMKEEIAGMTDDADRRKAAARVALGLVYGLQVDGADD
ncbi:uncharacterized protein C8Q71DRAFT_349508 [Rhodofomes roseus]|uniref:Uncharacterized protein n=1 Tax=Rhodofomes roseus TaxID=34475 RepID=A0A4Y9XNT3_9APHY|nr:uncharacterized protein C8Q71DRAFT_349508 [Rhodofomes roseus]KAH9841818.1 hypothetical protein C8Q71DRAFT_349508 [Rhodofomes roseus]TFY51766.1 hypothetical protein EVJ58_g10392 [Rhodofomes roseus]